MLRQVRRYVALGAFVAVILAVGAPTSLGAFAISTGTSYDAGATTDAVAVGDFNRDGIPDLATGNGDGSVSILLGTGSGYAAPTQPTFPQPDTVSALAVADLNRDGDLDLVVASGDASISILLGNGDGTFSYGSEILNPGGAVAIADLNHDDIPDLAVADEPHNDVDVFLGVGDGTFVAASSFSTVPDPLGDGIAVGDLNRDGNPDLAVTENDDQVTILLGDGTGSFSVAPSSPFSVDADPGPIAIGDLNRDGAPDLVVGWHNGTEVLLGDGNGGIAGSTTIDNDPSSDPDNTLAIGDLNGDGIPDVVAGLPDSLHVLLGDGTGSLTDSGALSVGGSGYVDDVAVSPLDSDGLPDIVATGETNAVVFTNQTTLAPWAGFVQASSQAVVSNAEPVAVADFDGDGKPDFVIGSGGSANVGIYLGDGAGGFSEAPGSPLSVPGGPGHGIWSLTATDVNDDGKADVIAVDAFTYGVSVFLGNGDGTFGAPSTVTVGSGPVGVVVGDFDRDGKPDLAISNANDNDVSILLGNGDGTFTSNGTVAVGHYPWGIVVGDFDGDGKLDLATANENDGTVTVLSGNGDGTFTTASTPTVGSIPESIAAADLNRDGALDLVVGNRGTNDLSVLLGNGDGTFQAQSTQSLASSPQTVALADVDGDGVPDAVVAFSGSSTIETLLGDGSGGFSGTSTTNGFNSSFGLALEDMNRDGRPDAVVSQNAGSVAAVLLGSGDPDPPTGVTGTPDGTQITVSWSAPASNGGSPITDYTATASPGGATCDWSSGPLQCTVTGLTLGQDYTFTVTATNGIGTSVASSPSATVNASSVPDAPTNVSATAVGTGQAVVSWQAPGSDGGQPIDGYTATASPGGRTCTWDGGSLACTVTGLSPGGSYTFTVTAHNSTGESPASSPSGTLTLPPAATAPNQPRTVSATAGDGRVTVSWSAPSSDGGSPITAYTVSSTPGSHGCAWASGPLSCTVSGLSNGVTYTFTVTARNEVGSGSPSAAVAAIPAAPVAHAGSYFSGSTVKPCAKGTYQPKANQTSCLQADPGSAVPATGSTTQTPCAAGTYQPNAGATSCTDATAGNAVASAGAAAQTPCAAGTYQPNAGASSCVPADPGSFVASVGLKAEKKCAVGSYQPSPGASSCTPASPGSYVGSAGARAETPCAAGSYQPASGQGSCKPADPENYVSGAGASAEIPCPAGTWTNGKAEAKKCTNHPLIATVSPSSISVGVSATVELDGAGFGDGSKLRVDYAENGQSHACSSTTWTSSRSITCSLKVAGAGAVSFTATVDGVASKPSDTIDALGPPTLASVTGLGEAGQVVLGGTSFAAGDRVDYSLEGEKSWRSCDDAFVQSTTRLTCDQPGLPPSTTAAFRVDGSGSFHTGTVSATTPAAAITSVAPDEGAAGYRLTVALGPGPWGKSPPRSLAGRLVDGQGGTIPCQATWVSSSEIDCSAAAADVTEGSWTPELTVNGTTTDGPAVSVISASCPNGFTFDPSSLNCLFSGKAFSFSFDLQPANAFQSHMVLNALALALSETIGLDTVVDDIATNTVELRVGSQHGLRAAAQRAVLVGAANVRLARRSHPGRLVLRSRFIRPGDTAFVWQGDGLTPIAVASRKGQVTVSIARASTIVVLRMPRRVNGFGAVSAGGVVDRFGAGASAVPSGRRAVVAASSTWSGSGGAMVSAAGRVWTYGTVANRGSLPKRAGRVTVTAIAVVPSGAGYLLADSKGRVWRFGAARWYGDLRRERTAAPIVSIVPSLDGRGYELLQANGVVRSFGSAVRFHKLRRTSSVAPIVSAALTNDGTGLLLVDAGGRVFALGAARRYGDVGGRRKVDGRVVGIAPTPTDKGYTLVTNVGRAYRFGDAKALHGVKSVTPPVVAVTS